MSHNESNRSRPEREETTSTGQEDRPDELESASPIPATRKRSAFSELMTPKHAKQIKRDDARDSPSITSKQLPKPALSGLLLYITKPESLPPGTIIRETEHTILIRDLYPKSLVHLLLLPRNPDSYNLTPFEAFNGSEDKYVKFLELMMSEAASAAQLAASELSRLVSPYSTYCKARNEALDSEDLLATLPQGRDFLEDIKIGIHAQPSMNTLHVHIISADNYSPSLKTKKHYNSFNTNFFVSLDDFPLMEGDNLMDAEEQESLLKGDMKCWRCGKNFGNKFKQLKEHLKEEYKEWRAI